MATGNFTALLTFQGIFLRFIQLSRQFHGLYISADNSFNFTAVHGFGFNLQSLDACPLKLHGMGQHGERLAVEYMHMAELIHAQGKKCLLAVFQGITSLRAGMAAGSFIHSA